MLETKYFSSSGVGSDDSITKKKYKNTISHTHIYPQKRSSFNKSFKSHQTKLPDPDLAYDSSDLESIENEIKYVQFKTEETTRVLKEANRQLTESAKA